MISIVVSISIHSCPLLENLNALFILFSRDKLTTQKYKDLKSYFIFYKFFLKNFNFTSKFFANTLNTDPKSFSKIINSAPKIFPININSAPRLKNKKLCPNEYWSICKNIRPCWGARWCVSNFKYKI